jgi:Tfp pilus assembly major pilin PilA
MMRRSPRTRREKRQNEEVVVVTGGVVDEAAAAAAVDVVVAADEDEDSRHDKRYGSRLEKARDGEREDDSKEALLPTATQNSAEHKSHMSPSAAVGNRLGMICGTLIACRRSAACTAFGNSGHMYR